MYCALLEAAVKITKVTAGHQHLAMELLTHHLAISNPLSAEEGEKEESGAKIPSDGQSFSFGIRIVKLIRGPVAQLDRANGYEPLGREFESLRAHHTRL